MAKSRLSSRQVFEFACYKITEELAASKLDTTLTELEPGGIEFKCNNESIYLLEPVTDASEQENSQKNPEWKLDPAFSARIKQIDALKAQHAGKPKQPVFILPLKESFKAETKQWVLLVDRGEGWELWDPRVENKAGFGHHSLWFIKSGLGKKSGEIVTHCARLQLNTDKNSSGYFVGHIAKSLVTAHFRHTERVVVPEIGIENLVQQAKLLFAKPVEPVPTYPMLTAMFKGLIAGLVVAGIMLIILAAVASLGGSVIPTLVGGAVGGAALGTAIHKRNSSKRGTAKLKKMPPVAPHNLWMPSSSDSIETSLRGLSTITMQSDPIENQQPSHDSVNTAQTVSESREGAKTSTNSTVLKSLNTQAVSSPTPASGAAENSQQNQAIVVPAELVSSQSSSPSTSVLGQNPPQTSEVDSPLKTWTEEDRSSVPNRRSN